jgi:hypothetical protein
MERDDAKRVMPPLVLSTLVSRLAQVDPNFLTMLVVQLELHPADSDHRTAASAVRDAIDRLHPERSRRVWDGVRDASGVRALRDDHV